MFVEFISASTGCWLGSSSQSALKQTCIIKNVPNVLKKLVLHQGVATIMHTHFYMNNNTTTKLQHKAQPKSYDHHQGFNRQPAWETSSLHALKHTCIIMDGQDTGASLACKAGFAITTTQASYTMRDVTDYFSWLLKQICANRPVRPLFDIAPPEYQMSTNF